MLNFQRWVLSPWIHVRTCFSGTKRVLSVVTESGIRQICTVVHNTWLIRFANFFLEECNVMGLAYPRRKVDVRGRCLKGHTLLYFLGKLNGYRFTDDQEGTKLASAFP